MNMNEELIWINRNPESRHTASKEVEERGDSNNEDGKFNIPQSVQIKDIWGMCLSHTTVIWISRACTQEREEEIKSSRGPNCETGKHDFCFFLYREIGHLDMLVNALLSTI